MPKAASGSTLVPGRETAGRLNSRIKLVSNHQRLAWLDTCLLRGEAKDLRVWLGEATRVVERGGCRQEGSDGDSIEYAHCQAGGWGKV